MSLNHRTGRRRMGLRILSHLPHFTDERPEAPETGGTCPRSSREEMSEPRQDSTHDPSLALQPGPEARTKLSLHKGGRRLLGDPSPLPSQYRLVTLQRRWISRVLAAEGLPCSSGTSHFVKGEVWGKQVYSVGPGSPGDAAPRCTGPAASARR